MQVLVPAPPNFNFARTVISHGWSGLSPCEFNRESWMLTRVLDAGGARPVTIEVNGTGTSLSFRHAPKLSKAAVAKITRDVRHMFRLDDDLSEFYTLVGIDSRFAWIATAGAGRLLRSPTVFEDLVKTICTTNCSWALTEKMVTNLVTKLGRETTDGRHAFPTPDVMASQSETFYRDEMRAGYRAPYFSELAERVASGSLNVEAWLHSELPTDELKREMKRVKGVGDYAAENLLKLVGRYDGLALDSWVRAKFTRTRNNNRAAADKKIERYYRSFKSWRGLALWCDMTQDWMEDAARDTDEEILAEASP